MIPQYIESHGNLLQASPILAEEQQESEKAGLFGLPDFSSFFGGGSGAGSMIPNFGNMFGGRLHEVHSAPGDLAPAISDPSSDPAADDSEGDEQHNRLFFSLIPRLTACNFTTQVRHIWFDLIWQPKWSAQYLIYLLKFIIAINRYYLLLSPKEPSQSRLRSYLGNFLLLHN